MSLGAASALFCPSLPSLTGLLNGISGLFKANLRTSVREQTFKVQCAFIAGEEPEQPILSI